MDVLDKVFELLDEEPDLRDAPDAVELPPVRGEIAFETSRSPTAAASRACATSPRRPAGPDGRAGRRDRRRQDDDRQPDPALLRPDRRARARSTATTCAT